MGNLDDIRGELQRVREELDTLANRQDISEQEASEARRMAGEIRYVVNEPSNRENLDRRVTRNDERSSRNERLLETKPEAPKEEPRDALSQLWHTILSGVVAPFDAFASARTSTQVIVLVFALIVGLGFFVNSWKDEVVAFGLEYLEIQRAQADALRGLDGVPADTVNVEIVD